MPRTRLCLATLISTLVLFGFVQVGYAEEGWASWYGPGFHGNRMANGQVYDMYDPTTTAANQWPFGTWIKVTNPANGKSVTVQVRDRGAFKWELDMSYAAFQILDDPNKMMIRVNYEVVPGPESPPATNENTQEQPAPRPAPPPAPAPAPAPAPTATPVPAPKDPSPPPEEYTVQPGDTLNRIAARYGIDVGTIISLNGIENPNSIVSGQLLQLKETPRPSESFRGASGQNVPRGLAAGADYTVQPGDTFSGIASQLGIDPDTLAAINDIENRDLIAVGQRLRTSAASASASTGNSTSTMTTYAVEPGDTLSSIADSYGVSEGTIAELNGISDPNSILVGQQLQIPTSTAGASPKVTQPARKQYAIKAGETLSDVAANFVVSIDELVNVNGLSDPDLVQVGQVLTIP